VASSDACLNDGEDNDWLMKDDVNWSHEGARAAAFRALLATGRPVSAAGLAAGLGTSAAQVQAELEELDRRGQLRLDGEGRVVGSCGLSVVPSRHELQTGGRRFWTWCAYDAAGILGALRADGTVRSVSVATGRPLEVTFRLGSPETDSIVIVMPDRSGCDNVVEEWCPHVNFVEDEQTARSWLRSKGQVAEVVPIAAASRRGAAAWATLIQPGSDSPGSMSSP